MIIAPIQLFQYSAANYLYFKCYRNTHLSLKSQKRPSRWMFVYKIQLNPIHTIVKYGIYYDFMDKNGAVLKSSSQCQLKEF